MPFLPTLEVSQAHWDKIVAAFPGEPGAQKTAAYKAWLTNALIDYLERVEVMNLDASMAKQRQDMIAEVQKSLPPRQEFPPTF